MISRPPSATRLLGRQTELETLTGCLRCAAEGSGTVAVVEGEAGIGKTRLLDEMTAVATRKGFRVLRALCEDGVGRPFGPVLDALARAGPPFSAAGVALVSGSAQSEYRLVEEISDSMEALCVSDPLLLALDDLQWADPSTLATVRRLARRLSLRPVAIVAAVRPVHASAVAGALDDLLRLGAEHVQLAALSDEDAAALVLDVAGLPPGDRLLDLVRGASGNPLYLVELTRSLIAEGSLEEVAGMAEVARGDLPATFRAMIIRRLHSLSEQAVRTIESGAILGPRFKPAELAAVLARSAYDLAPAAREAVRAGIWEDAGDRLGFTHALVRQAIYEDIPPSLRRQRHREMAEALEASGAESERVAMQVGLGADRGDASAVRWLREAAARAVHQAPGTAAGLLERAREIVGPTDPQRDELLADLAMAWATTGRLREAEALATEVLRRGVGSAGGRLRIGIVYALTWQGRPAEAWLESGRPDNDLTPADQILLAAEGSVAEILMGDAARAAPGIRQSLQAARHSGHRLALCHALSAATRERMLNGHLAEAVSLGKEAVALAEADLSLAPAQPWFFLGLALTIADRTEEAEAVVRRGREVAEDLGLVWSVPLYMSYLANVWWLTGRWDDALAEDEAGRAVAEEFGMHLSVISASASRLTRIALHRGRLDQAEAALAEAEAWLAQAGRQGGDALVLSARGLLLEARGDLLRAAQMFETVWQRNVEAGVVSELRLLGPDLVRLYVATGRVDVASSLIPEIEHMASKLGVPSAEGAALRCRGLVAGDPDALAAAAVAYRRSPRVVELAQTCEDAAVHLATAGRKKVANEHLEEAVRIFESIGATRDLARLQRTARRLGLTGPRSIRPATGWDSLTTSEQRVATLVAEGATNRRVGSALFVSTHTVDSHLRHVFAKLGITSRVQLARIVAGRQGSLP